MQTFFSRLWADKRFRISCGAVIVICLAAHGFAYANSSFLHDRNAYFSPVIFNSVIRAKWMAQFWDCLIYFAYLPWLSGVLIAVMFIASVYMIADMLRIRHSWIIWLIAGICITHSSVIYAHLYWPTEILAALPMAVASAWCWKQERFPLWLRMGLSTIFIGLSLASYGAYASAGPFLVIIIVLLQLLDGKDCKKLFLRGLEYIGTFLLGLVFYYVVLRLFLHFQELQLLDYANESRLTNGFPEIAEILGFIKIAYRSALVHFVRDKFLVVNTFLGVILLLSQVWQARKRFVDPRNTLLLLFLLAVIPLCAGLIYVLAFGSAHGLMIFGYAMPLVLIAALLDREFENPQKPQGSYGWASFIFTGIFSVLFIAAIIKIILPETAPMSPIYDVVYPLQAIHLIIIVGPIFYLLIPKITAINIKKREEQESLAIAAEKSTRALVVTVSRCLLILILFVTVYKGILTANLVYAKADQIDITTKSMLTRVMAQVESCEGFEGTETLIIYGLAPSNPYISFNDGYSQQEVDLHLEYYGQILFDAGYTYVGVFPALLKTNANSALPITYYDAASYTPEEQELVAAMPVYPASDSIKKIGDTIVIKLSEE